MDIYLGFLVARPVNEMRLLFFFLLRCNFFGVIKVQLQNICILFYSNLVKSNKLCEELISNEWLVRMIETNPLLYSIVISS
jgi:hypothetical protein